MTLNILTILGGVLLLAGMLGAFAAAAVKR